MNKRNIIITIISVLILTCLFAFARTTTTDLELVKPTWTETTDILNDINANSDILEAFANDPLEFDTGERLEDRVGAMFTGNTETGITVTHQDSDNTLDVVIGADDIVETMLKAVNLPNDEEIFTYESTTGDFEWHTLAELSIQPLDAGLTSIAGLTTAASTLVYTTALDTYAVLGANATATNKWLRQVSSGAPSWETIADGDVPNDITIDLATLATTFTCTDNESEALACPIVFVDGATGAQGAETDDVDLTYNPSTGTLTATEFSGGGAGLTGVGSETATALTIDAKEENTSAIVKGQPVYGSGAAGVAKILIGLADCDDASKYHCIGIAGEAISQNGNGTVRVGGLVTGVDTLGANEVNPNGETWVANDILYLDDTAGGLTNVRPTVGHVVEIGHSLFGSNNTDAIVVHLSRPRVGIHVATGEDIIMRMGDSAGANKTYFKDYTNTEVAYVDSDGNIDGTALTVDTAISPTEGGTGVANNAASTLTISGNFATTITVTEATGVTLPASGTLATLAGTESLSNKTLTAAKIADGNGFYDANGNEQLIFQQTASAVNYFEMTNSATGNALVLGFMGTDTDVNLSLQPKGDGCVIVGGDLGIGSTPHAELHVDGGATAYPVIKIAVDSGYEGSLMSRTRADANNYRDLGIIGNNLSLKSATTDEGESSAVGLFIEHTTHYVGCGTSSPSGNFDINVATDADPHFLLSENDATKWDIYNDHHDDALQIKAGATLRYEFHTDGTANADVAWGTFSPVVEGVGKELLAIALEDANKPVKPYKGIPIVKSDKELFDIVFVDTEELMPEYADIDGFGNPVSLMVVTQIETKVDRPRRPDEFKTKAEVDIEYEKYHKVPAKIAIANAKYLEYLTEVIDAMQLRIDKLEVRIEKLENPISKRR